MEVNNMYFKDLDTATKFINTLHSISANDDSYYNDIHTYIEESAYIVEWVQIPYAHDWGGRFKYVDEGDVVMTEYFFPDNHLEVLRDDEEFKERMEEWLKEHPTYKRDSYGRWYNYDELTNVYGESETNYMADKMSEEEVK